MAFEFNSKPNRSEINRLNQAISAEEQNINTLFQKIGQTYFAAHRNDPEDNQAESIRGILDALERAKGYKEQINTLRGIAICPNCKAEVSIVSAFCNHCGTKMPAPPQPAVSTNMNTVICQSCGARCSASQRFCNQCGSPLQQAQPAAPAAPTYAAAPAYAPMPPAPAAPVPPAPAYAPVPPAPAAPVPPASAFEPVPAFEPAPVNEPAPVFEPAPAYDPAPAFEPVPVPEETPVEEPAFAPAPEQYVPQEPVTEAPAAPQGKVCPNCGTVMEPDCNFCLECGTRLN